MEGGGGEDPSTEWFYYGECLRNHATDFGTTATDGCGEFLPNENMPDCLLCIVCGCHRNFHRKILYIGPVGEAGNNQQETEQEAPAPAMELVPVPSTDSERGQQEQNEQVPATEVVAAAAPDAALPVVDLVEDDESEEVEEVDGRKRPRTTFTDAQKERMRVFAEDLEWKMVRHRSTEIDHFCSVIGVSRQSFKVWMHNHKNTSSSSLATMVASMSTAGPSADGAGRGDSSSSSRFR